MLSKETFSKDIITPFALFLLALLFRLWYMDEFVIYTPIAGDALSYVQYSLNLIDHGVFSKDTAVPPVPDAYWAPGFPLFLVLSSTLADLFHWDHYTTVLVGQSLLGAGIVFLTWKMGRLFLGYNGALLASVLTLFSPHLVSLGAYFLTETLFSFFLLLSLYLYSLLVKRGLIQSWLLLVSVAVTFGLAYLVNPVFLFLPFLLITGTIFFKKKEISQIRVPLLALVGIFLVFVASWEVRNYLSVPEEAPSSSHRVYVNLIIGSHEKYHEIWRRNPRDPKNPATVDVRNFEGSIGAFSKELIKRFSQDPAHYFSWYFVKKPYQLWSWNILTGKGDVYVYIPASTLYDTSIIARISISIMKALHLPLFLLSLLGMYFMFRDSSKDSKLFVGIIYTCLIYVSSIYVVLQAEPRYSIPLRPEFYLAAIYCIFRLSAVLKHKVANARADAP